MNDTIPTPQEFAALQKLRYINNKQPGYSRKLSGKQYIYYDEKGQKITDTAIVDRINALALPPAYTEVWICPYANGHLQATGKDARGRTQYRYHAKWRESRNQLNHSRMVEFGKLLPKIRKQVAEDLSSNSLSKKKILATIATIMDRTLIRVGNDVYAKSNSSYGLTTLRNKHVNIKKNTIELQFMGKSHKKFSLSLEDPVLAKIVQRTKDLPGYNLFEYLDAEKNVQTVHSGDLNSYLQEISGIEISAKDFRTWWATVYCYSTLQKSQVTQTAERANILKETIEYVASKLGNTPTVCRKHYIYNGVIEGFEKGKLRTASLQKSHKYMSSAELITLQFLQKEFLD